MVIIVYTSIYYLSYLFMISVRVALKTCESGAEKEEAQSHFTFHKIELLQSNKKEPQMVLGSLQCAVCHVFCTQSSPLISNNV